MTQRGTYKYICGDCGAENWLSARERSSRSKPRVSSCGSAWLEPSHGSHGPAELDKANQAAKEGMDLMDKKMGKNN